MSDLEFTGERYLPGVAGEIWMEHWHRYHFASTLVAGKRVLDVASGEGYGSALLAKTALHVTGADISNEAIGHATAAYVDVKNLAFVAAPCTNLPLADASVDVVVSFETIEHITGHDAFLAEIARVLVPEGLLVMSSPNKLEYSDKRDYANEFHVKELYREELAALLAGRFPHAAWYGQRNSFYSLIWPESAGEARGEVIETAATAPGATSAALGRPLYFIVMASRSGATLAQVPAKLSALADREDWVQKDYEKVMRNLEVTVARGEALEAQLGAMTRHHADAVAQRDEAAAKLGDLETRLRKREEESARYLAEVSSLQGEVIRRTSWRWWLKLPFLRIYRKLTGRPPAP
jgi:ubiquinone/menaquinone biosynthesis C-methylase UbiE